MLKTKTRTMIEILKEIKRATVMYPASICPISSVGKIIEIGPGRGDFLFHLALENPERIIIGVEIKPRRVDKLIKRIETRGLKNISLIEDDARGALRLFNASSVEAIYINFPDPWPKRKHSRHRLLSAEFIAETARVLMPHGILNITTDHKPYAESAAKTISGVPNLKSCLSETITVSSPYPTFFAQKWASLGRIIYYMKYRRVV